MTSKESASLRGLLETVVIVVCSFSFVLLLLWSFAKRDNERNDRNEEKGAKVWMRGVGLSQDCFRVRKNITKPACHQGN
jgi:hypothetical protein